MLAAEALKPFLLHEDRCVRDAAADWFGESRSDDPEILPLILRACELYGHEQNIHPLAACRRLAVSDPAFDAAREHLGRARHEHVILHLNRIVARSPFRLSQERESALHRTPNVTAEAYQRASRRRDLGGRTADVLWNEVQAYSRRHHGRNIDQDYAGDLVEALATHVMPDPDTLLELLASPQIEGEWLEVFLVELAGRRRLRSAAPLLLDKMAVEDDWLSDVAEGALARVADAETVRLIRESYAGEPVLFRDRSALLLGLVKVPEAEDAVLELLETERDTDVRTALCLSLCLLFSQRGIEAVRREIRSGYQEWIVRLEEEVVTVADVLGADFPEKAAWRAEREDVTRSLARRKAVLGAETTRRMPAAASSQAEAPAPSASAARKAKAGRNDPCPCGSGKKRKRCCGQP